MTCDTVTARITGEAARLVPTGSLVRVHTTNGGRAEVLNLRTFDMRKSTGRYGSFEVAGATMTPGTRVWRPIAICGDRIDRVEVVR